jgi:hypothetical protein
MTGQLADINIVIGAASNELDVSGFQLVLQNQPITDQGVSQMVGDG